MPERVRFGVFEFHLASGELQREGAPVRLPAQPAKVLRVLIEAGGELVTREALREAVWGSDTHVDFEKGLTFCISQIRSALRDSTDSPLYIATVPKRGYRFIAQFSSLDPTPPAAVPHRRRWIAAASVAVATTALAGWAILSRSGTPKLGILRFDNETGDPALDQFAEVLTQSLVAELTTATEGRCGIIGNAAILRQPRPQRDLRKIASALDTRYLILGQLQGSPARPNVLAHLIEMPRQTHLKVARTTGEDPATAAAQITNTFAPLLGSRS